MMAYSNGSSPTKRPGVMLTDSPTPTLGSPVRLAFPSKQSDDGGASLGRIRQQLGAIQTSPLPMQSSSFPSGSGSTASGATEQKAATVTRGRAVRRREPLKGDSDEEGGSKDKEAERRERRKSRQRTQSNGRSVFASPEKFAGGSAATPARSRAASSVFSERDPATIDADFENLLVSAATAQGPVPEELTCVSAALILQNQMEVAPALRSKLLGVETSVKLSMLKGKETLTLASLGLGPIGGKNFSSPSKRSGSPIKGRFGSSLPKSGSATNGLSSSFSPRADDQRGGGSWGKSSNSSESKNNTPLIGGGGIFSGAKGKVRSRASSFTSMLSSGAAMASLGGSSGSASTTARHETASYLATYLKTHEARLLDVARIKRMRAVLATESPSFIDEFAVGEGGYAAMMTRLNELLEMEWREEQHDDQLLHELLRSFVALNTTDVSTVSLASDAAAWVNERGTYLQSSQRGRAVLRSSAPKPFTSLVDLLLSEKKPGDLSTRKLIYDLLLILSTLPLDASLVDLQSVASTRQNSSCLNSSGMGLSVAEQLLLILAHNPRTPESEALVDFMAATHTPRPFKALLTEIAGVAGDYFWVFCHSQNNFWRLEQVDEKTLEGPKVPGGMTGGVEFEAMAYLVSGH